VVDRGDVKETELDVHPGEVPGGSVPHKSFGQDSAVCGDAGEGGRVRCCGYRDSFVFVA
jgi:hypothetical protein